MRVELDSTGLEIIICGMLRLRPGSKSLTQWRIQWGFLVARKPPPGHDFFNQRGDTVTGTDPHLD